MSLSNDQFKEVLSSYSQAELVPIHVLMQMKGNNLRHGDDYIRKLSDSMENEGLREPGVIEYDKVNRRAWLGEGNHRLNAAYRSGATHFPVFVMPTSRSHPRSVPVRGKDTDEDGYLPGTMKPSEIMDWEEL